MRGNVNGSPLLLLNDGMGFELPELREEVYSNKKETKPAPDDLWHLLLGEYTGRELTKEKDKLVAFAGVADHFAHLWRSQGLQTRYLAGLWEHQLPSALLWQVCLYPGEDLRSLPRIYRAPSWSWAAVDDCVYDTTPISRYRPVDHRIERCEVTLKRQSNPFGEVTAGILVLTCHTISGLVWNPWLTGDAGTPNNIFQLHEPLIGRLEPDSSEFTAGAVQEIPVTVAVLGTTDSIHHYETVGLALLPLPVVNSPQDAVHVLQYRRVGIVELDYHLSDLCSVKTTLHIV